MIHQLARRVVLALIAAAISMASINSQSAEAPLIERKYYNPWEHEYGYAPIVKVGNTLYLSGVTAPGKTMQEQVKAVYNSIGKMLAEYGATHDDIVSETVFTKDIEAVSYTHLTLPTIYSV